MGHAHHFLSRLERLSVPHLELALSLYYDEELLRLILVQVRLPEQAERAAISLDHPTRGPFLVVTRQGRFVTCLGEGMVVGDLPIITRPQLDGVATKMADLRVRIAACTEMIGKKGSAAKLMQRIHEAGDNLSREEFHAVSAFHPLWGLEFVHLFDATIQDVTKTRMMLLDQMRKSKKLKPIYHEVLKVYWQSFWSMGHLAMLIAMNGPPYLEQHPAFLERVQRLSFSWFLVRQGIMSLALKGAWCVAKLGKALLGQCKRAFATSDSMLKMLNASMGMVAIALRHGQTRAEVQKALAVTPYAVEHSDKYKEFLGIVHEMLETPLKAVFEQPEACLALHRHMGAVAVRVRTAHLPDGSPLKYTHVEDVPEELAMVAAVNERMPFNVDIRNVPLMLTCLPWVGRATPEMMYLPEAFIQATRVPWTPSDTTMLLEELLDDSRGVDPAKANTGPSRKGPCPCGSGKKYKRCCGQAI